MNTTYALLDSGKGLKLEQFGDYRLVRPCGQAMWKPSLPEGTWTAADAFFSREGGHTWEYRRSLPDHWVVALGGVQFKISPTDFGHLGVFPEHSLLWKEMQELIHRRKEPVNVLNLFAYSGGATLAAAQAGARVCHLDASQGMVAWARENAHLNGLAQAPIRWIVDDAMKFLRRELKRNVRYDAIILDPPSFGRGNRGEVFKIERDLGELLSLCRALLSASPLFVFLTTHTPGMTPIVMDHLMDQMMHGLTGTITAREMNIPSQEGRDVPCGSVATWFS